METSISQSNTQAQACPPYPIQVDGWGVIQNAEDAQRFWDECQAVLEAYNQLIAIFEDWQVTYLPKRV